MYRVEDIEIDVERGCLSRSGEELHLRRKSFQVLTYLLENRDCLVSKEELFDSLWNGVAVTDDVLVQCIKEARRALGDDPNKPRFIKTVPRSGYRFIGLIENNGLLPGYTEEITRVEFEIEEESDETHVRNIAANALPGRLRRPRAIWAVAASVLICLAGVLVYFGLPQTASKADIRLPRIEGREAVAVMYFENASGEKDLDWMREGLADMLITNLSRSERLTVLSRQQLAALLERSSGDPSRASIGFDGAMDIAGRSGAEAVVSGSFARLGEKIRINIQVYETATGSLRASESLTAEKLDDVLSQIDILSLKLARHLNADTRADDPGLAASMTQNLEAYRYYSLGVAKAHALENKEAVEFLQSAVRLDPEFAMAHARIGYAYAVTWARPEEGKPFLEKAFELSSRTTARDRRNIAAWYAIAHRDFPAAIEAYREIIKQYPLDTEAYWRLGRLLAGEQRTDEAIDIIRQGIAVDPESKNLYNSLGGALSTLSKHQEAIAAHQRYVALAPNEPNAYDSLALTYQWAGDYDKAIETFRRALEVNPNFDLATLHLGYCQIRRGEYQEAMKTFDRFQTLVSLPGEKARAVNAQTYIYRRLGDTNGAERSLARQMTLTPIGSLEPAYYFAIESGQTEKAKKLAADTLLKWEVSDRGSRANQRFLQYFKGSVALNEGREEEALEYFRDVLSYRPPSWHFEEYEDCLAQAYLKIGRYDEAIAEFERVLQISPNYPRARFYIARAYRQKGMTDEARANYQRFLTEWKNADADLPEIVEARAF